jgi:hypothetical protein
MLSTPDDAGGSGNAQFGSGNADQSAGGELAELREREREMLKLLGSTSPDRLIHDLRNLINELQLLRTVLAEDDA